MRSRTGNMAERPRATLVAGRSGVLERARGHAGRRQDEGARNRLSQETAATRRYVGRTRSRARVRRPRRAVRGRERRAASVTKLTVLAMSAVGFIAAIVDRRPDVSFGSKPDGPWPASHTPAQDSSPLRYGQHRIVPDQPTLPKPTGDPRDQPAATEITSLQTSPHRLPPDAAAPG